MIIAEPRFQYPGSRGLVVNVSANAKEIGLAHTARTSKTSIGIGKAVCGVLVGHCLKTATWYDEGWKYRYAESLLLSKYDKRRSLSISPDARPR